MLQNYVSRLCDSLEFFSFQNDLQFIYYPYSPHDSYIYLFRFAPAFILLQILMFHFFSLWFSFFLGGDFSVTKEKKWKID